MVAERRPTRMPRTGRLLVLPMAFAAGLLVVTGPPASALSCVGARTVVAEAEVVFAGRIVDSLDGRVLVEVDEVWQGGPVEEQVWLRDDLPGWSAWADADGEIPDDLTSDRPWVFAPHDQGLVNSCTTWPANSREVRGLRPAQTEPPVAENSLDDRHEAVEPRGAQVPWGLLGGVAGGMALAGAAGLLLVVRKRGRSAGQGD